MSRIVIDGKSDAMQHTPMKKIIVLITFIAVAGFIVWFVVQNKTPAIYGSSNDDVTVSPAIEPVATPAAEIVQETAESFIYDGGSDVDIEKRGTSDSLALETAEPEVVASLPALSLPKMELVDEEALRLNDEEQFLDDTSFDNISFRNELKAFSSAFAKRDKLPLDYTCFKSQHSLPVSWRDIPEGTASLALIIEDVTNPKKPMMHWGVFNINPDEITSFPSNVSSSFLKENAVSAVLNDFNTTLYVGPCQRKGEYKYSLTVFALSEVIDLPSGIRKEKFLSAVKDVLIDRTIIDFVHYYRL